MNSEVKAILNPVSMLPFINIRGFPSQMSNIYRVKFKLNLNVLHSTTCGGGLVKIIESDGTPNSDWLDKFLADDVVNETAIGISHAWATQMLGTEFFMHAKYDLNGHPGDAVIVTLVDNSPAESLPRYNCKKVPVGHVFGYTLGASRGCIHYSCINNGGILHPRFEQGMIIASSLYLDQKPVRSHVINVNQSK